MSTTRRSAMFTASAAAISAIGLIACAAPGQARPMVPLAPACKAYGFPGNTLIREVGSGWSVSFDSDGQGAGGRAVANYDGGQTKSGNISGSITGSTVNLTINYDNGQTQGYKGTIDGDGHASGVTGNGITKESGIRWNTETNLTCLDAPAAAPAAPADAPAQVPAGGAPVEAKPLEPPTITSGPILGGVSVTVKDHSGVTSQCTYTSGTVTKNFTLPANGSASVNIVPLVQLGVTYDVHVGCDNGTSLDTTVKF